MGFGEYNFKKKDEESNEAPKLELEDEVARNKLIGGFTKVKNLWDGNKGMLIGVEVGIFILSLLLSNTFPENAQNLFLFLTFIALNILAYKWFAMTRSDAAYRNGENYKTATGYSDEKGSADKMREKERKETFKEGDYSNLTGYIVGALPSDPKIKLAVDTDFRTNGGAGMNNHLLGVGVSGSGKTRSQVIPEAMHNILLGKSMVIMDPKLDSYSILAAMAKARGYHVKSLLFDSDFLLHSDSCNFMSFVRNDQTGAKALADIIVYNIGETAGEPFWDDCMSNLLTYVIMYLRNGCPGTPANKERYKANLGGVYKYINEKSDEQIIAEGAMIDKDHPCKISFNNYSGATQAIRASAITSLRNRLQALGIPEVAHIASDDDIDLNLIGQEKCLYFVGIGTDHAMRFLSALFWSLTLRGLVAQAKRTPSGASVLKQEVVLIMDEFVNCGIIPSYTEYLTTVRSYGIDIHMFIQNMKQMETAYPNGQHETIIGNCSVLILLKTNLNEDADYFSIRSGVKTVKSESKRYERKAGDLFDLHMEYQITEANGERRTYTLDEMLRLNPKHNIVFVSGHNPIEVARVDYSEIPMCKEIRPLRATRHMPLWLQQCSDAELELLNIEPGIDLFDEEIPWGTKGYEIEQVTKEELKETWTKEREKELEETIRAIVRNFYGEDESMDDIMNKVTEENVSDYSEFVKELVRKTQVNLNQSRLQAIGR